MNSDQEIRDNPEQWKIVQEQLRTVYPERYTNMTDKTQTIDATEAPLVPVSEDTVTEMQKILKALETDGHVTLTEDHSDEMADPVQ